MLTSEIPRNSNRYRENRIFTAEIVPRKSYRGIRFTAETAEILTAKTERGYISEIRKWGYNFARNTVNWPRARLRNTVNWPRVRHRKTVNWPKGCRTYRRQVGCIF